LNDETEKKLSGYSKKEKVKTTNTEEKGSKEFGGEQQGGNRKKPANRLSGRTKKSLRRARFPSGGRENARGEGKRRGKNGHWKLRVHLHSKHSYK